MVAAAMSGPILDVREQAFIDRGLLHTREDAAILARLSELHRFHCRYADRKDAVLMALADAKAAIRKEVNRIVNDNGGTK